MKGAKMDKEQPTKINIVKDKIEVAGGNTITIEQMYCPNCGKRLHTVYSRCRDCGQRLKEND